MAEFAIRFEWYCCCRTEKSVSGGQSSIIPISRWIRVNSEKKSRLRHLLQTTAFMDYMVSLCAFQDKLLNSFVETSSFVETHRQACHQRSRDSMDITLYGYLSLLIQCCPKFVDEASDGDGDDAPVAYSSAAVHPNSNPNPTPALAQRDVVENEMLLTFLGKLSRSILSKFFGVGAPLRVKLVQLLINHFGILPEYQDQLLHLPGLFAKPKHFQYCFLHALSYSSRFLRDLSGPLLSVAVLLGEFSNLHSKLQLIDDDMGTYTVHVRHDLLHVSDSSIICIYLQVRIRIKRDFSSGSYGTG